MAQPQSEVPEMVTRRMGILGSQRTAHVHDIIGLCFQGVLHRYEPQGRTSQRWVRSKPHCAGILKDEAAARILCYHTPV